MSTLVGGMCSHCCHIMALVLAFMQLYRCFFALAFAHSFLFCVQSGIEMPDRNGQWYQHPLTLFAIFTRAIPKGLPFGLCLDVLHLRNVHVLYCIQFVCEI